MILTFVDHDGQRIEPASLSALCLARGLGGVAVACFVSESVDTTWSHLRAELAAYGAETVFLIDEVGEYSPEAWGSALAQLITHNDAAVVVAGASDRGNELMAQAAARLDLPFASNCVELSATGSLTRVRGGGILLEDAEIDAGVIMASVMPTAAQPSEAPQPSQPRSHTFVPELDGVATSTIIDRTSRGAGVSLASAPVVVSGGRGVGSAEGFAPLEELASLVRGAVGCSRVVTNNGWRPHSDQVGQTGTKVTPRLYIACGISGATQHWVGCMDSKAILAINTDAEAPMVTRATYAVIGDVQEIVPAVVAEIKRRREV